jgi:hypothetical protein
MFPASGETIRTGSRVAGPSERLALSLLSPMPNEQDFAVNVCTVLAADHSNRLPLASTPHILDFLLAHAGVYNHCEYIIVIISCLCPNCLRTDPY